MKNLIFILTFLSISLTNWAQEPKTRIKRDPGANDSIANQRERTTPEIILSQTTLELFEKEDDFRLTARIRNGQADSPPIEWTSTKPAVATVDATGKIKALTSGKTFVKATLPGAKTSVQCEVTVSKANYWGNSNASLADGGMVASQNDWIYYANPYDSLKLYKININGSGKTKLSNDIPDLINVIGRNIYYQNTNEATKGGFYRIDIDGNLRTLINDLDYMYYLRIAEHGFLVYLNQDYEVYRLTTRNLDRAKIKFFDEKDQIPCLAFDDYYGYYTKWWEKMRQPGDIMGGLYIYDIKKKKSERLITVNSKIDKFIVGDDGWIYYFLNGSNTTMVNTLTEKGSGDPVPKGLFRRNLGDVKSPVPINTNTDPLNKMAEELLKVELIYKGDPYFYWTVQNNWIYYIESWKSPVLRRVQTDGKKDQKVVDIPGLGDHFGVYSNNNYLLLHDKNQFIRMLKDGRDAVELK